MESSWEVTSCAIRTGGVCVVDWPPEFKYGTPRLHQMTRSALWAIEQGLGGAVEWASLFVDPVTVLSVAKSVYRKRLQRPGRRGAA